MRPAIKACVAVARGQQVSSCVYLVQACVLRFKLPFHNKPCYTHIHNKLLWWIQIDIDMHEFNLHVLVENCFYMFDPLKALGKGRLLALALALPCARNSVNQQCWDVLLLSKTL